MRWVKIQGAGRVSLPLPMTPIAALQILWSFWGHSGRPGGR